MESHALQCVVRDALMSTHSGRFLCATHSFLVLHTQHRQLFGDEIRGAYFIGDVVFDECHNRASTCNLEAHNC